MVDPADNPTEDDAVLARQAQGGSAAAFGQLVHRHHGRVFALLLALTRHRQDAEDLTQETFLRAWNKICHFDPAQPLIPWLLTLARRQSITALRRRRPVIEELPPASSDGPSHRALQLWELAKARLKPDAYTALWLHYREELPLKQVAAILGKREGAVKVLLHRARQTLAASVHPAPHLTPPDSPHSTTPRHETRSIFSGNRFPAAVPSATGFHSSSS